MRAFHKDRTVGDAVVAVLCILLLVMQARSVAATGHWWAGLMFGLVLSGAAWLPWIEPPDGRRRSH